MKVWVLFYLALVTWVVIMIAVLVNSLTSPGRGVDSSGPVSPTGVHTGVIR